MAADILTNGEEREEYVKKPLVDKGHSVQFVSSGDYNSMQMLQLCNSVFLQVKSL